MVFQSHILKTFLFSLLCLTLACGEEDVSEMMADDTGPGVRNHCRSNPTTQERTMCVSVYIPEDIPAPPEKMSLHFFNQLPPVGPPNQFAVELDTPSGLAPLKAGYEVPFLLDNLPTEGELYLYLVMYFPGGGATTWVPVEGVDYTGSPSTDTPFVFDGNPINVEDPIQIAPYSL